MLEVIVALGLTALRDLSAWTTEPADGSLSKEPTRLSAWPRRAGWCEIGGSGRAGRSVDRRPGLVERKCSREAVVDVLADHLPPVGLGQIPQERKLRLNRPAVGLILGRHAGIQGDPQRLGTR